MVGYFIHLQGNTTLVGTPYLAGWFCLGFFVSLAIWGWNMKCSQKDLCVEDLALGWSSITNGGLAHASSPLSLVD